MRKLLLPISIVIAGIIIAGAFVYINQGKSQEPTAEETLSSQQVADKAIDYINKNKDTLIGGNTASLLNISEEGSIYKIRLKVGEQKFDSYVTKDGKFLFPGGYNLEETTKEESPTEQPKKMTCEDIEKADKPLLEAFVVSGCPYGLQMQRILDEIVKNIPSLTANIKVEYIGSIGGDKITSMHGDEEAQENLRQICLREEQPDKYWNYIDCYIKKGEVESCLIATGVDRDKLAACMTDNSKGLNYAKEDFERQDKYKATGSPALFLNGEKVSEFDFGGRTAEAVKTLLCCGFKTTPDLCSQKLTIESAAISFSETYSKSSGSSGGSCK